MQRLTERFTQSDREAVNQAVQQAEAGTSAEILPAIASCSGRYDRPEDIIGVWVAVLCLTVTWIVYPTPEISGSWSGVHPAWQWVALAVSTIVGFVIGVMLGSRIDVLRFLFTPKIQMREEVFLKARGVFYDNRVHHTAGGSGVLLYVSLFERMAVVIADESVLKALGQEKLNAICTEFTHRLHGTSPINALCETIHSVGQSLSPVLPRQANDVNEIPDALLLID